ncbi:Solute carrier family 2, facilitated glucose transporter member 1-like protein [Aphelenchoides besseyi]|nr:Solute carrier family 2, facilitated glucose transporter member 1-like protein [Aphelenchoides besseyi]KAI6199263.1 Solute carrier family 2, facilitated glucose transporter member 1-like protein [Aphelenchoides besseyi]
MMEQNLSHTLVILVVICCSFRMGYNMSAVNPTEAILVELLKQMLKEHFNVQNQSMTEWIYGLVTGSFFLAATFGALSFNALKSHFGRRTGLLISQFIFIFGSVIQALAYFSLFELFIIGQVIIGYALGLSASFLTLFIEEVAHSSSASTLYTLIAIAIEIGTTMANIIGVDVLLGNEKTWPAVFLFPVIFNGLCSVILLFWIHETPIQLLKNSNRSKALESIAFYYQLEGTKAEERLSEIEKQFNTQTTAGFVNAGVFSSSLFGLFLALFFAKNISHRLLLLIGIPVMCVVNVGFIVVLSLKLNVNLQATLLGTLMIVFCLAFSNSVEKVMWYNGTTFTQPQYIDATSSLTVAVTYFTAFLAPFFFSPLKGTVDQWSFMLFIVELIAVWIVFFIWYPKKSLQVHPIIVVPSNFEDQKTSDLKSTAENLTAPPNVFVP